MKYQELGTSGIEVSQIAFGAWGLGGGNVWSDRTLEVSDVATLLDAASEQGITYVDTAPVYGIGASEEILGAALKGRRDKFVVQTKCSLNWRGQGGEFEYERDGVTVCKDHHAAAIRADVEDSLVRMGLDVIDSLVVHRVSQIVPVEETVGELCRLIEEGKIRTFMISNSEPSDFEEYATYGPVAGVQEKFSLLVDAKRSYFETLALHNATFQVYGSLEQGYLAKAEVLDREYGPGDIRSALPWANEPGKSALRELLVVLGEVAEAHSCSVANIVQVWTLAQYDKLSLLTGFRRVESIADTCRVFDIELTSDEVAAIEAGAAAVREAIAG